MQSCNKRNFILPETKSSQLQWDQINCKIVSENLKTSLDQHRLACFLAASQPHTGSWLTALPASSLGNLLLNDCLRYAVALRTGSNVCQNFTCHCGEGFDKFGLHPLSCVKSRGRYPRHCALNDIVFLIRTGQQNEGAYLCRSGDKLAFSTLFRGTYLSLSMSCKVGKAHEDATMKV